MAIKGLVVLVAFCTVALALSADEPAYRVHASLSKNPSLLPLLRELDYKQRGDLLEIFLSERERSIFARNKISFEIKEVAQPLYKKFPRVKTSSDVVPAGYSDLSEILASLESTVRSYPAIAQLVDSSSYGVGVTYEGRKIPIIKISGNVSAEEDEPAILINSNIHAREIVTPVLATEIIRRLTTNYASDPTIRNIVDKNAIYIMPTINPDGYNYMWEVDNLWRKNRKPNRDNSFGVDCNRNFDLGWDVSALCSGSSIPSSETYRGESAGSEEETQIVKAFSSRLNLAKLLDFHSSGREVLVAYLCVPMTQSLDDYIVSEGEVLAKAANYNTRRPSSDGEHQEWNIANVTAYSYLVETETEFQPEYTRAIAEFERIWPLTLTLLQRIIPLSGHITFNNAPIAAVIRVNELGGDVTWHSEPRYGRYHIFLPDGVWTLSISSALSSTRTVPVRISNTVAAVLNIAL